MLRPLFDITPLKDRIEAGATLLTPNQRLARALRHAWDSHCLQQGRPVWRQPTFLALDSWIEDRWQALLDCAWPPALQGSLIAPAQERLLWQQIIQGDAESPEGSLPEGFAELARRGWQLKRQWQLTDQTLQHSAHEGAGHLLRWGKAFAVALQASQLISRETVVELLTQGFAENALPTVDEIVLIGFQTTDPLTRHLLKTASRRLNTHCSTPSDKTLSPSTFNASYYPAPDTDSEIAAAADWARQLTLADPSARIGIVIPELPQLRHRVERIFRDRFEPGWCLPHTPYRPAPFNISAGIPLAEAPLAAAAFKLLALNRPQLPWDHYCQLLHNRYWGNGELEIALRSQAEWLLRDKGKLAPTAGDFRHCIKQAEEQFATSRLTGLSSRLQALANQHRRLPRRASCREWAGIFQHQLDLLGWPGQPTLDSQEYQQQNHWLELLETFATLDQVTQPLVLDAALHHLNRLARDSVFQLETPDAPVQILGTLEAAGLQFTHLWVTGMDSRHWPQPLAPHPLLPVPLQQQQAMPRASISGELALAQALFNVFRHSADHQVFSYPQQEGDRPLQPAALIADLPQLKQGLSEQAPPPNSQHPWVAPIAASAKLERVDDCQGPPLPASRQRIRGGSRLLQEQAGCPFNAFAIWRLGAEPLPEPILGLDPFSRGNLLHQALEIFWQPLPDQAALLALTPQQIQQQVAAAIDTAIQQLRIRQVGLRHLQLEKERQCRLILQWLNSIERNRTPFSIVSLEKAVSLTLAGLEFAMRIDRIDKLDNGRHVLIDYKTGDAKLGNLAQERLREPQLPLYALASDLPLAAVTYGVISNKGKGVRVDGVGNASNSFTGLPDLADKSLPETWEKTLEIWHNSLIKIAKEFKNGEADVCYYHPALHTYSAYLEPLNRWPALQTLEQDNPAQPQKETQ